MKNAFINLMLTALVISSSSLYAADKYQLDPNHTAVMWKVNHFGFSNPSGKWYAEGTLLLDKAKPEKSQVNVSIKIAKISTGLEDLDKHLKGKLFFNVEKYPDANFISEKIELTGADSAKIHGQLTLHGMTKPVILETKLNKMGVNPINNKDTIGFSAHATLKRSDFGISTLLPGLSDEVEINIETEAGKIS